MIRRFTIRQLMLVIAAVAVEFAVLPIPLATAVGCLTLLVPLVPPGRRFEMSFVVGIIGLLIALLLPAYQSSYCSPGSRCSNNLRQIALALSNYHSAYGCFPPAYVADKSGRPMHSWRVLILPFLEQQALYDAYDFAEPWDGPNNIKLADRRPTVFSCSGGAARGGRMTDYMAITGSGTAFSGARPTKAAALKDGGSRTILVAEVSGSMVCWTEPRDLDIATMSYRINDPSLPSISSDRHGKVPAVAFADGQVQRLDGSMKPETLRAMVTTDGGTP